METEILTDFALVRAVVYVVTSPSGKHYVGQTRTHILNHAKYRPFGAHKRWIQHVSEARSDNRCQSWGLNNAIRKYGPDAFLVETIGTCELDEVDAYERFFIELLDSRARGYNIQHGGVSGAKNSEEACAQIAETLKAQGDDTRLEKFRDFVAARIRLGRTGPTGVRLYATGADGRESVTNFGGRRSTLKESYERAMVFAEALAGGDKNKITVSNKIVL